MTHACKIPMSNEHNMQKCPGAMEDARPTCKYASEPWEIHSPDGVAAGMPATPCGTLSQTYSKHRWIHSLASCICLCFGATLSCSLFGSASKAKAITIPFFPLRLGHIAAGSLGMHEHFGTSITRVIWLRTRSKALHSTCILTVILSCALQATQFINIY